MFTYEEKDTKSKIETYEWEYAWRDRFETDKRILIIGDSISVGYRGLIAEASGGVWRADGLATSKGIDNEYFKSALDSFIEQREKYDFMIFNNGLHGWHLSAEEYGRCYKEFIMYLLQKNIPLAIVLTTPAREKNNTAFFDRRNYEVIKRNTCAAKTAEELNIPIIDNYTLLADKRELFSNDGIHLSKEGYMLIAKNICNHIKA